MIMGVLAVSCMFILIFMVAVILTAFGKDGLMGSSEVQARMNANAARSSFRFRSAFRSASRPVHARVLGSVIML